MASYVEGIVVQQAGVAQAGVVSPQIAEMFAHIQAELGKFNIFENHISRILLKMY